MTVQRVESSAEVASLQGRSFRTPFYLRGQRGVRITDLSLPLNWLERRRQVNLGSEADFFGKQCEALEFTPEVYRVDPETGVLLEASVSRHSTGRSSQVELVKQPTKTGWAGEYRAEDLESWEAAVVLGGMVARSLNCSLADDESIPGVEVDNIYSFNGSNEFFVSGLKVPSGLREAEREVVNNEDKVRIFRNTANYILRVNFGGVTVSQLVFERWFTNSLSAVLFKNPLMELDRNNDSLLLRDGTKEAEESVAALNIGSGWIRFLQKEVTAKQTPNKERKDKKELENIEKNI